MPWCDTCSKYYAPNGLNADGTCPACGRMVAEPPSSSSRPSSSGDDIKAPWHFKLLVASVVAYLGWRAWQGVAWVIERV